MEIFIPLFFAIIALSIYGVETYMDKSKARKREEAYIEYLEDTVKKQNRSLQVYRFHKLQEDLED